jgi:hypothetical protein
MNTNNKKGERKMKAALILALLSISYLSQAKPTKYEQCIENCNDAQEYALGILKMSYSSFTTEEMFAMLGKFDVIHLQCKQKCRAERK